MGIISNVQANIKAILTETIREIKAKREENAKKHLAAKLKNMNDDELEEYIMVQMKKLQKGSKDTKKEAKTAVVTAIQSMDEPEKQLEVTVQIGEELTKSDKGQIIKSIDSTSALLEDNGIDIIKGLDKKQKLSIVERIIANQRIKAEKVPISNIAEAVDKIYYFVNEANDFTLLRYISTVQDRIAMANRQENVSADMKDLIKTTQLKLVKLAAKKIVCNYKNIGYAMRIREFMQVAFPTTRLQATDSAENSTGDSSTQNITKKSLFLDAVEVEGDKIGLKNAKQLIGDLLAQEEKRYQEGEIKKIQRDAGKNVVQRIVKFKDETDDITRS